MSRLIDAEDFSRTVSQYMKNCIDQNKYNMDVVDINVDIQELLDKQPTIYDVDKVVEKLECAEGTVCGHKDNTNGCGGCAGCTKCNMEDAYRYAIEIVRKGGRDE